MNERTNTPLRAEDEAFLRAAVEFFEAPGLVARGLGRAGGFVEAGITRLPAKVTSLVLQNSRVAIEVCAKAAIQSLGEAKPFDDGAVHARAAASQRRGRAHTVASAVAGGVSGFLGPGALLVELPVTTTLLMRSIVSTARDFGFDANDPKILLECLSIFAIGGPNPNDDGMNSSYFSFKLGMPGLLVAATDALAGQTAKQMLTAVERGSTPAVTRLLTEVAEIFGVRVTKKLVAQWMPIFGAIGGAGINVAFCNFFSKAARYHFGMKRLEIEHGAEVVVAGYQRELTALRQRQRPV